MATICFVSYEIHPTTWGGCGVLLHHAAELLLRRGHTIVFLLDIPLVEFERFDRRDRLQFSNAGNCRAYHVDTLCRDFPFTPEQITINAAWKCLRFAHACDELQRREQLDFIEFFEYCGVGYYAMIRRLFSDNPAGPVLGVRLHNPIELIDYHASSSRLDRDRYGLYGLEHAGIHMAEAVLTPTRKYYEAYCRDRYRLPAEKVVVSQSPKLEFPRVQRRPDPDEDFTIVTFGRLFSFKGIDQFVHAACILLRRRPEVKATIELIGYDSDESPFGNSYAAYLKTLIPAELLGRFRFTGQLSHEQTAERLNQALFAVFPNRFESFCYAAHEIYDAGVPLIVQGLPGFGDFFTHEKNALVYDGTTEGLVTAMERMLDDHALRERLCRPYAVADKPLGDFYDKPRALCPIVGETTEGSPRPLIVVLSNGEGEGLQQTVAALREQTLKEFDAVELRQAVPGTAETMWWLGRPWHVRDLDNRDISPTEFLTRDAIAILMAGDRPAPAWIELCVRALSRRPNMAFAGTWVSRNGAVVPSYLDTTPEAYPFEQGAARTRVMIRTEPGRLVLDLFDRNLGSLGEIGYIWHAIARWGPGCLYPAPRLEAVAEPTEAIDANLLHYLLARFGEPFADRLKLLAGLLQARSPAAACASVVRPGLAPTPSVERKRKYAAELGGRDLLKIILRKLASRARGRTYEG